jgi:hypothetical protein
VLRIAQKLRRTQQHKGARPERLVFFSHRVESL